MKTIDLHPFLLTYFKANNCEILHDLEGVLTVQLTEKMDKTLMNRPFYWHYLKSTGQEPNPMKLTLITNPQKRDEEGEWIHFGSPRLQQITDHLKQENKHIKLFQQIRTDKNTALYPWLITNIKMSYQGKQNKEELFSIGLHLVNGMMKVEMMNVLQEIPLNMTISDYCYPISPLIKLKSGFNRIDTVLENYIKNQTHEWAEDSLKTLKEEIALVEHFYEADTDEEQREKEIKEITKRYTPTITSTVINGGIIYLSDSFG